MKKAFIDDINNESGRSAESGTTIDGAVRNLLSDKGVVLEQVVAFVKEFEVTSK